MPEGTVVGRNFWSRVAPIVNGIGGFLDSLTGNLTKRLRNLLGMGGMVNENTTAYRIGTYLGQAAGIALTLIPGGGWVFGAIRSAQAAGGLWNAEEAFANGDVVGGLMAVGGALLNGARAVSGTNAACKIFTSFGAKAIGKLAGYGMKGLMLKGAGESAISGVKKIVSGDIVGGLLDIGQAGAELYNFRKSCFTGEKKVLTRLGWIGSADGEKDYVTTIQVFTNPIEP